MSHVDRDLAMYQDTISLFNLPVLRDRYEMLRQLGNVFIVQPEILKTYLNESYLGRIENRLLRPFVMMRTDYSDFSRRWWDEIFGGEELPALPSESSRMGMMGLGGRMREFIGEEKDRPQSILGHI